ncbi:hypothetical protein BJ741DRAFT_646141 [Chytriomyces cf. hyalinus JEL632]|nr:hypothetical protein BJ741DRAFT_646141 [Chytriomyces cf. hyalinus JEL632]
MQAIIIALAAASAVMAYEHNPAPPKQEYYAPKQEYYAPKQEYYAPPKQEYYQPPTKQYAPTKEEYYAPSKGYTTNTPFRCGSSWENANSKCGTPCTSGKDYECGYGEKCFRDLQKTCDSYQQPSYQQKQQQYYKSNGAPQYKAPEYKAPEHKQPEYKEEYKQPEYKEEYKQPTQEKSYGGGETYTVESVLAPGYYAFWSKSGDAILSKTKDIFTYNIISKTQIQITVKGDEYNSKDVCLTGEKKNYGDLAFAECSSYGTTDISSWSVEEVGTGYGYDQYKTDNSCVYVVFKYQDSYGKAWCVDANSNDSYGVKEGTEMVTFECKPNHKPQQWKVCETKSHY